MTDRLAVPEIESALRALPADLDVPEVDLAPGVTAAIATVRRRPPLLRPALALGVLVLATALVVAIEPAREAVADWLGIGSTRIEVTDTPLDVGGLPPVVDSLGTRVTGTEAARVLGSSPRLPDRSLAGEPAGWLASGDRVTALWAADSGLPEIGATGLGLLLTQGPGDDETIGALKQAGPGVVVEPAPVNGDFGIWIEGDHLRTADGGETTVAANVLLWARRGQEFRLESNLDLPAAMAIAESVGR